MSEQQQYTCSDYRAEMILMGLTRRLHQETLTRQEREEIVRQIDQLKSAMGMD